MRRRAVVGVVASALAVWLGSGCVNQNSWRPTIDPYNDANSERLGIDEAQCRQIAQQSSGGTGTQTGKGVAMGGLFGAAMGAAIGAAVGDPGAGAAVGAAAGGFGGGARGASKSGDQFKQVFRNCMRGRGHNVLD